MRTRARDARRGPRHVRARGELGSHGTPSMALRSGFIAPRGGRLTCWRRRIQYDRERGGGKLHALTM